MDMTGNPWLVNAADVAALAAVVGNGNNPGDVISVGGVFYLVIWKGAAKIWQVEFAAYVGDTDTAEVDRYNTKNFAFLNGASDLETVRTGNPGWTVDGLIVPNNGITNGGIKIYHA